MLRDLGEQAEHGFVQERARRERRSEGDENNWFDEWLDDDFLEDEDEPERVSQNKSHGAEPEDSPTGNGDDHPTDEFLGWFSQWFGSGEKNQRSDSSNLSTKQDILKENDGTDPTPSDDIASFLEEDPFPQTYQYRSIEDAAHTTIPDFQRKRGDTIDLSSIQDEFVFTGRTPQPFGLWFVVESKGVYLRGDHDGNVQTSEINIWMPGLSQVMVSDLGLDSRTSSSILNYSRASTASTIDLLRPEFSDFTHVIGGKAQENVLKGSDRDDLLEGGQQSDWFDGRLGQDTLKGHGGSDWVSYRGRKHPVTVRLISGSTATAYVGGEAEDTLHSIENIEGTDNSDVLRGDNAPNHLRGKGGSDRLAGEGGNDVLRGGDGPDVLDGGDQNDWLLGGGGDDKLSGGAGDDRLEGGEGFDTLVGDEGRDCASYSRVWLPVVVDMSVAPVVKVFVDGTHEDTLHGIEDIRGGNAEDTLIGDEQTNWLNGGVGDDTIKGRGGRDWLFGEADNDRLFGGLGHDRLEGGKGRDILYGEEGDDWLQGGPGFDVIDGGPGNDTLSYIKSTSPINVRLLHGFSSVSYAGAEQEDRFLNIENVAGTAYDDIMSGNIGANVLTGHGGNDRLYGNGDADVLYGNDGKDHLEGGWGDDVLQGGNGADLLKGDSGADRFIYWNAWETIGDVVRDFNSLEGDRIRFYGLDANSQEPGRQSLTFSENGSRPHTLWFQKYEESGVMLLGDTDGQVETHEIAIHVEGVTNLQSQDLYIG